MNKFRATQLWRFGACLVGMWLLALLPAIAQQRFRIMEYNVENLFDTIPSTTHADHDFTPQGSYKWTSMRYWSKVSRISRVVAATGDEQPADLVALIEVENDSVLADLVYRTKLHKMGYDYIVTHSPDVRGINVALLYQPQRFRIIHHDSVRVAPPQKEQRPTRDVLHVAGVLFTGDTLDVFICHLPSRRGGGTATEYRANVTNALRNRVDQVMQQRHNAHIVITGDFNAYYPESIFTDQLKTELPPPHPLSAQPNTLYLLSHSMKGRHDVTGTYKFQGVWNQLDQFIVNGRLLNNTTSKQTLRTQTDACRLVDFPFLLQRDRNGEGFHPYRTFLGPFYQGGFSDHLPLILDLFY